MYDRSASFSKVSFCALLLFQSFMMSGQITEVGNGSYTTQFPGVDQAGRNGFPSGTPYTIGPAATKPVPTNDWWSAQIKNNHADNLFNYPYTMKSINSGLIVSYMPWGVIDDQEPVIVGVSGLNATETNVVDFSDWTVSMDWANGNDNFQATAGIGMPFLYFNKANSDVAQIEINEGVVQVIDEMIIIENAHNGADFVIYAPAGSSWTTNGNIYTSTLNGNNYWSMAFLPLSASNINAVANEYKKYAYVFPSNTTTSWTYNEQTAVLRTDFTIATDIKEGSASDMLVGLLPHQWDNLSADSATPQGYSYQTVRGELKMMEGNAFSVENKFYGILPTLPYLDNYSDGFSPSQMNEKIQLLKNEGLATWTDSYNQGQEMNRLIQTARIADLSGDHETRDKIVITVKDRLEDWLKAESNEVAFLFYYDQNWSTLIGYPAGHGQDTNINDHHFHWGYFIHAAAFVEQYLPGWVDEWGAMVDHLVRDAASKDRNDSLYPFLRNFSPYAGHCWANGFASFPQGNDQESTSESMQFNSSLIHWGTVTGNDEIRDLGIYLYTTEQTALEEYWFDIHERNFSSNQQYSLVSRIWGNSYDNGTFWTNDIEASYGIELYPIHGGSLYLGHHPDYVQKLWTEISQNTGILNNDTNNNLWHDVMWEYQAFIDPAGALALYNSFPERGLKFGISDAQTYHWLHAMNVLGQVDISITSDNPLAAAFSKDGERTYVAHNYIDIPIDVTYSDGFVLTVPARSMATSKDIPLTATLSSDFSRAYPGGAVELQVSITGANPDSIQIVHNDQIIGSITQSPLIFEVLDLQLGINSFYAKVYLGDEFKVTNSINIQVGEQVGYNLAPTPLPGSFFAGHFDKFEGGVGQDIAYNENTPANLGGQRIEEYVDVFASSEGDAIGWIASGEWVEYTVDVAQAGYYNLDFRYASDNASGGGPFKIESDGESVISGISVSSTGGWATWATKSINDIPLKSGEQVLRLLFENGELNIAKLTFTYDRPLDYDQPIALAGEDILVVLPETTTTLDGSNSFSPGGQNITYTWTQLYGPSILNFSDSQVAQPSIDNLKEGVYLVQLTVTNGSYSDCDELYIISSPTANFAPEVFITSPTNNSDFFDGTTITISANASDLGGTVTQVDFLVDGESIGIDSEAPYSMEWTPSVGQYSLSAVATDNSNGMTTSIPIDVAILETPSIEGTWKLKNEAFSIGVGPTIGDIGWWSCDAGCVTERSCFFDDAFVFEPNGTFRNEMGSESWVESWQDGSTEGCRAPVSPHDGTTMATWTIAGNMLTINGKGAFIGLPKVNNGGELSNPSSAPESITYPINLNATSDTMIIDINYGGGIWHYELVKVQGTTTSITEELESQFIIYPNPVSQELTIQMPSGKKSILLYDLTGRMIDRYDTQLEHYNLNTSRLQTGMYIIKVQNEQWAKSFKVIKE